MTQLKPCPFCGNKAYIYPVDEEGCAPNISIIGVRAAIVLSRMRSSIKTLKR